MAQVFNNLIEETSTSTGTGSLVVANVAIDYRLTLASVLADADTIELFIVNTNGEWEHGIYEWDEPSLSVVRGGSQKVIDSSNAGAAVTFTAGLKKVYSGSGVKTIAHIGARHYRVFAGGADPTVNDDVNDGYGIGSQWQNGPSIFYLVDPSAGNATWRRVAQYANAKVGLAMPRMYVRASIVDDGNAVFFYSGLNTNGDWDETTFAGEYVYMDGGHGTIAAITVDATPEKMAYESDWPTNYGIYVEGIGAMRLTGSVIAMNKDTGDIKSWAVAAVVKGAADGTVTVMAGAAPTSDYNDAGMAACSIAVVGSVAGDYDCTIEVTGIAATNIIWSANLSVAALAAY